jgi:hypothetical protein
MELVVSNVAASVVKKALKGDNQMIRFYLQTHGPDIWKSTNKLEHSGPGGGPLTPPVLVVSFLEDEVKPDDVPDVMTLEHDERAPPSTA